MDYDRKLAYRERCGLASIPLMQVRHKSIVVYPDQTGRRCCLVKRKPDFKDKKAYSGRVTAGVRKRLTKAINLLLQVAKPSWKQNPCTGYTQYHRISFITLKIANAENVTAHEAYLNCLSRFLDWLTRTAGVKLFIWKAEFTRNKQIHYHVTCPDMVNLWDIRNKWNSYLRTAGYLDEYAAAHGHYNANSTDIHSVNDIENLSTYMIKALTETIEEAEKLKKTRNATRTMNIGAEMAKDCQNEEETEGKIWGCSEVLAAAHYVAFHMSHRHSELLENMETEGKVKRFTDDSGFWAVLHFTDCSPPDIMSAAENSYIEKYLTWQISKPSKSCTDEEFDTWLSELPRLSYN